MARDITVVYSSEMKRNKQKLRDAENAIGIVKKVLIFVRQNPKGKILDVYGIGIKGKRTWRETKKNGVYHYYCCPVSKKTDLEKIIRLVQMKINSVHWIELY